MKSANKRPHIGVMGSASGALGASDEERLALLAKRLGEAIAQSGCVLVTGATTGLPDKVAQAARAIGGLTVGISPASNNREHIDRYQLPADSSDVMVYTGFGLKGRNVVNIRSSDIVIIISGGIGTLNEFTIAYDEGKVIGVLEGSGGITDQLSGLIASVGKRTYSTVIFDPSPENLIEKCLGALHEQPDPPKSN